MTRVNLQSTVDDTTLIRVIHHVKFNWTSDKSVPKPEEMIQRVALVRRIHLLRPVMMRPGFRPGWASARVFSGQVPEDPECSTEQT